MVMKTRRPNISFMSRECGVGIQFKSGGPKPFRGVFVLMSVQTPKCMISRTEKVHFFHNVYNLIVMEYIYLVNVS